MLPSAFKITNDIRTIDRQNTLENLNESAMLSLSYIILLSISTIICTLGLLLDSPAIVIGGMIISPLMWPLMKIAAGISLARKQYVSTAILILVISIGISLLSSFLITLVSPLKVLNAEILARTQPTLLDIVIALSAGVVAALAIVHKKISSSIAGVAIATSLMPPLCVAGIGLALMDWSTASGGLLLFVANVVSIIFVSIFAFRLVGIEVHAPRPLQTGGIVFVSLMLVLTAFPLFFFLRSYSFEAMAYQKTYGILQESLERISPAIYLENVKTTVERSAETQREVVQVDADILIPEDVPLDFHQKEAIITELENAFDTSVRLNLRVQKTIALETETDIQTKTIKQALTTMLQEEIEQLDHSLALDNVTMYQNEPHREWVIESVIRSDPSFRFTELQRRAIEQKLSDFINQPVTVNLEIISRIRLQGQSEIVIDQISEDIRRYFSTQYEQVRVSYVSVSPTDEINQYEAFVELTIPKETEISPTSIDTLASFLRVKYHAEVTFFIDRIEKHIVEY